ncbi:MAG: IPT/TIG domain-containing protein, partial [Bryobacteraceae bacterium]
MILSSFSRRSAILAYVAIATTVCSAQTYDVAAAFEQGWTSKSNPNGVWSYGYSSGFTNPVTLYSQTAQNGVNGPNAQYWVSPSVDIGTSPAAEFNNGPAYNDGNIDFLANEFVLVAGIGGQYSDLVFTVPADGSYSIVATFRGAQNSIGTVVGVVANGSVVFSSSVTSEGQLVPFSAQAQLQGGDTIVFSVGPGGGSQNTGLAVTITAGSGSLNLVAEPTSLTFSYEQGGSQPANQNLVIASSGAALVFDAASGTAAGGNWLSVAPTSGTTSASLTVSVNAAGLAAGAYNGSITVTSASAGNSPLTVPVALTVMPPPPIVTSLAPPSAIAGGQAFTLTVNGAGFLSGATVQWNGSSLATTYINTSQLTAQVPASLIAAPGSASVAVVNPGGSGSNTVTFTITSPTPHISGLMPASVSVGGPPFTLTVNGSGFLSGATVRWNSSALVTSYVNGSQLTAAVPSSLIVAPGSATVTVVNSAGGLASNAATVTIAPSTIFAS